MTGPVGLIAMNHTMTIDKFFIVTVIYCQCQLAFRYMKNEAFIIINKLFVMCTHLVPFLNFRHGFNNLQTKSCAPRIFRHVFARRACDCVKIARGRSSARTTNLAVWRVDI